jgi:hypothetical protein
LANWFSSRNPLLNNDGLKDVVTNSTIKETFSESNQIQNKTNETLQEIKNKIEAQTATNRTTNSLLEQLKGVVASTSTWTTIVREIQKAVPYKPATDAAWNAFNFFNFSTQ